MIKGLGIAAVCLLLSGCGSGSLGSLGSLGSANPFGRGAPEIDTTEPEDPAQAVIDGTVRIARVESAVIDAALRGGILRVTAVAEVPGYHNIVLVREAFEEQREDPDALVPADGVFTYELRGVPPAFPGAPGPVAGRRHVVATFIPDSTLDALSGIEVLGRDNAVRLRPR